MHFFSKGMQSQAQENAGVKAIATKLKATIVSISNSYKQLGKDDPRKVLHSLKVALAITVVSFIYYNDKLFSHYNLNVIWAVMTVVVVSEFTAVLKTWRKREETYFPLIKVHADTIRLVPDYKSPGSQRLSFTFDAFESGSFTIFYVAKEEANYSFKPVGSVRQEPKRFQFQKGRAQKFDQLEGGINLSLFKSDEIFKRKGDVYPLVISAEICSRSSCSVPPAMGTSHGQITQAVLEKNTEGHFQVKVMNQKSWWHKISTNYEPRDDISDTDVPLKKRKKPKPGGDEACNAGFRAKHINSNMKGANFIFNNVGQTYIFNIGPGAGGRNGGKKAGSINDNKGEVNFNIKLTCL